MMNNAIGKTKRKLMKKKEKVETVIEKRVVEGSTSKNVAAGVSRSLGYRIDDEHTNKL